MFPIRPLSSSLSARLPEIKSLTEYAVIPFAFVGWLPRPIGKPIETSDGRGVHPSDFTSADCNEANDYSDWRVRLGRLE